MAGSLLAYLYPHIRGSQEDVATLSLSYLLAQSDILRSAFTKALSSHLHLSPDASIHFNTQVIGQQRERPDIVGVDDSGMERIICEGIDRYYMVIDNTTELLLRQDKYPASKKGLRATPLWNGHVQYIKVNGLCLGIFFYRELWKKDSSVYTPFWLMLCNDSWKQNEPVVAYLNSLPAQQTERNHDGNLFIALEAPVGCTLEETADTLAKEILMHVKSYTEFYKSR